MHFESDEELRPDGPELQPHLGVRDVKIEKASLAAVDSRDARLGELAAALVAWVGKQGRMSSWHLDGCAGASDAPCECGVPEVIKAIKKSLSKGEGS